MKESDTEEAALGWFRELGCAVLHGPDIGPEEPKAERARGDEVVLVGRLREAAGVPAGEGRFGAHMKVALVNDGPATFVLHRPRGPRSGPREPMRDRSDG